MTADKISEDQAEADRNLLEERPETVHNWEMWPNNVVSLCTGDCYALWPHKEAAEGKVASIESVPPEQPHYKIHFFPSTDSFAIEDVFGYSGEPNIAMGTITKVNAKFMPAIMAIMERYLTRHTEEHSIVDSQKIVNQAPVEDQLSQKARYRFYKSPEDEKAEIPFLELYVFNDNDICIRDHTNETLSEVLIPNRFVGDLVRCIEEQRANPVPGAVLEGEEMKEMRGVDKFIAYNTMMAADNEDKKIEALVTMTAAYVKAHGDDIAIGLSEGIRAAMIVFREQLGLPLITRLPSDYQEELKNTGGTS